MRTVLRSLLVPFVLAALAVPAHAKDAKPAEAPAPADDDLVDVTAAMPKLKLITDGKGHYMAFVPFGRDELEGIYWGDGKDFWQQRRIGYGAQGTTQFDISFWEPRVVERYKASFDFKDKKYSVLCDDRTTELTLVPAAEAKPILDAAKFHKPRWRHQAYALARDTKGKYYYVDKQREPEGNKFFRVFAGERGKMKEQKLKNIVSDSEGDIFSTKDGQLRLVLDKNEVSWTKGKRSNKLVMLPIEDNVVLIYSELGVYAGQSLGTPCDDI